MENVKPTEFYFESRIYCFCVCFRWSLQMFTCFDGGCQTYQYVHVLFYCAVRFIIKLLRTIIKYFLNSVFMRELCYQKIWRLLIEFKIWCLTVDSQLHCPEKPQNIIYNFTEMQEKFSPTWSFVKNIVWVFIQQDSPLCMFPTSMSAIFLPQMHRRAK